VTEFKTGEVIGERYRVIRRLGEGGFARVYLVEHLHLPGEPYALKVLKSEDEKQRARFLDEMRTALKLVHTSIVTVREFNQFGDLLCYAMDYVDGPTLKAVLEQAAEEGRKGLGVERAVRLTCEVLEGLAFAHGQTPAVVHRDMKPDNVILFRAGGPQERARILDFGIAKKVFEDGGKTTSVGLGTPAYMSPEQVEGKAGPGIGPRADIYSVGCMLYELLAGRTPFVSETGTGYLTQHLVMPPPPFSAAAPDLAFPPGLEAAVLRTLEKRPEDRFASAADLIEALEPFAPARRTSQRSRLVSVPVASVASAAPAAPAAPPPPAGLDWSRPFQGQAVGDYRIVRLLGEGGFGVVCEAEDEMLGRRVAVKLLRPELTRAPQTRERFRREGRVLASLKHPAIVTVYAAGLSGDTCYLVMELCEGETLEDRIARDGPLAPPALADLLRPVCAALKTAHDRGIVHRDLKPANLFLLADGPTKILDFGIAQVVRGDGDLRLTRERELLGSLAYVSPEQARGERLDGRSDIYSLGVLLFEALTGRLPFEHEDERALISAHLREPPPPLAAVRPDLAFGEALEAVVARALAKEGAQRFEDALAFSRALDEAVRPPEPAPAPAPPPAAPAPVVVKGRRARIVLPAAPGGRRTLFVIHEPVLRFGRARPDQQPPGSPPNTLVLRLLPCRSLALDPRNYAATKEISTTHATIEEREGAAWLVDSSTKGTWIDGVRAPRGTPVRLPARFRLGVAGVLELDGLVFPEHPDAAQPLEAVWLGRVGNWASQSYLWVPRAASLRLLPEGSATPVSATSGHGRLEVAGDEIRGFHPGGLDVGPARLGDEVRAEGEEVTP